MAMRIESVREKASGTLEGVFSGGLLFHVDAKDAELLGYTFDRSVRTLVGKNADTIALVQGELLDEEAISALRRLDALHEARMDALSILARAEQGSRQLYEKLLKKGYEPEIARICLTWLYAEHYVDDRRYVTLLLRSHMVKKGQGPVRIKALAWPRIGLFEHPKTIFADAFASLDEDQMQEAIRRSCTAILKRTQHFSRGGRRLGGSPGQAKGLPRAHGGAQEQEANAELRGVSFAEQCLLLRAHLLREGFPSKAVEVFLESLGEERGE